MNSSYAHAQTDLHRLATSYYFFFSPSPVGVECGSAVLHVVGAQVETSLTLGDSRQNSGIYCKPFHSDLTIYLCLTAATANVIGCYGNVGVASCAAEWTLTRRDMWPAFKGSELVVVRWVVSACCACLCCWWGRRSPANRPTAITKTAAPAVS